MCGISGGASRENIALPLAEILKKQTYRGYDSAGLAVASGGRIKRIRRVGKFVELESALAETPLSGAAGIGHTRWATHGAPSERNAHPHVSGGIAVVHNGIIENYRELRDELEGLGFKFVSDTDTESAAHLICHYRRETKTLAGAVRKAAVRLRGSYALGVISSDEPGVLVAARSGSPLVIGVGKGANFIASDSSALAGFADKIVFLEDGDIAEIQSDRYIIDDAAGRRASRPERKNSALAADVSRGEYRHFMQKEIFEQPAALKRTLRGRLRDGDVASEIFGKGSAAAFRAARAVQIIACGTSFYAGSAARYWLEPLADIPCQTDVASEWRYRFPRLRPDTLYVFISQSGETADTLACLRMVKEHMPSAPTLAIVNVPGSSLSREARFVFHTAAGPEIGVASTKAFTTQLVSLLLLTLAIGKTRGLQKAERSRIAASLAKTPVGVAAALRLDGTLRMLAAEIAKKEHALFLGRGSHYPVAMEGALKLKEISYIHAEGYQAGELKHGPLALVDENMPVIAVAPNDALAEKLQSNLKEVRARNGRLIVFAPKSVSVADDAGTVTVALPECDEITAPIVSVVPLQLLAYHTAVLRGNDVDQPRNLAKSVTVE